MRFLLFLLTCLACVPLEAQEPPGGGANAPIVLSFETFEFVGSWTGQGVAPHRQYAIDLKWRAKSFMTTPTTDHIFNVSGTAACYWPIDLTEIGSSIWEHPAPPPGPGTVRLSANCSKNIKVECTSPAPARTGWKFSPIDGMEVDQYIFRIVGQSLTGIQCPSTGYTMYLEENPGMPNGLPVVQLRAVDDAEVIRASSPVLPLQ